MKPLAILCAFAMSTSLSFAEAEPESAGPAVPEVSAVKMVQATDSRLVTITYTLTNAPAIITLEVQTNNADGVWTSIGGAAVSNAKGDVWKKVTASSGIITWRPDLSWPGHKIVNNGARAVVTAWDPGNTPDYMIVDISASAEPHTQRYYPSADFVPGGITNDLYKTTMLPMRKIIAKGIKWTMGSVAEDGRSSNEQTHTVELDSNYYIGVYEISQSQWMCVATNGTYTRKPYFSSGGATRPMEGVTFNDIRAAKSGSVANGTALKSGYFWPNDPHQESFIGLLRSKTGIDFDLPSEAQWEFACRAGHGEGKFGDGSLISSENAYRLARCKDNPEFTYKYWQGGDNYVKDARKLDTSYGTDYIGNHEPNSWGIYDMLGNVGEICLDWYQADIGSYNGAVNVNPDNTAQCRNGAAGSKVVSRGGSFYTKCRSAMRASMDGWEDPRCGLRVACRAGLE